MNKQIHITKRNIWRSVAGALITAVMSFACVACAIDECIEPGQTSGELQTATFEFSFSAGTPANRTRAGVTAWDDTAVKCVWVGIFIDDERYGEDNGKLIGAESWNLSSGTVPGGSHNTGVFSEKVAVSVMFNDAQAPRVRAAGVANFDGILGYKSPTEEAENLAVLLANIKNWDEYMAIAVDAASADAAEYRIMSNLVTFEDKDTHHNYTVNADGTVTSSDGGTYNFQLDGYSRNRITGWLHLRRLISHATVDIKTGENVEVTNLRYQVFNAPTRTYVQERTMEVLETTHKDGKTSWEEMKSWEDFYKISPNAADYFFSDDENYPSNKAPYYTSSEAKDIQGTTFEFSHYDNKHWGLKDGSCEAYADREKVHDGSELYSSLCTDADTWYNNYASYFRIYATVTDKTKGITADVVYTIHDGFCNNADLSPYTESNEGKKARDFMFVRNTDYTYNVTIAGINSIIVNVMGSETGETGNAGASGTLTEYVYEADSDGKYNNDDDDSKVESVKLKLTDAQRSSLKWRLYTPASDAFDFADFGTFESDEFGYMAEKHPGNWKADDGYSTNINENDDFYKAVKFYSGDTEIGTLVDFTAETGSDNSSLKEYSVKIGEYAAAAKNSSESESLARILYLYAEESYSAGGSEYKPLFVFKQYPQDGRGTLSTPEIESIQFVNSISASPSAAIATYVESMTAKWSESSFDGRTADVYEIYIWKDSKDTKDPVAKDLIATVENGTLTYTTEYVSTLPADTYTLGVIAKVSDGTLKPSEMALKEFEIYPATYVWDFSTDEWNAVMTDLIAAGTDGKTDYDVTLNGLHVYSGNKKMLAGDGYYQSGGAGSASERAFSFEAYGPGILKVVASNTGGSADMDRKVTVQLGNDVANAQSKPGGYVKGAQQSIEFYLNITEATTVFIYPTANLCFYSIEFIYLEQEPIEPTVWDFASTEWQAEFARNASLAKGTNQDGWTVSLDGLTYTSGTANGKWDSDSDGSFIQPNGAGDTSKRVFSFVATTGGTVKVTAKSASTGNERDVNVVNGGATKSNGVDTLAVLEFEVEAGSVYIYPGGGIRFYSIEFDGGVQK